MPDRNGFTLIELLIVMVIIGILAAIAIPKFNVTRERAYVSSMRTDLRNLANLQANYYADHYTYTSSTTALGYDGSEGVTLGTVTATGTGWSASVTHPGVGETCALFFGDASALSPATTAGAVTCG